MFSTAEMRRVVSGDAWVAAMLEVEAALARAEARDGIIPFEAAEAVVAACASVQPDVDALADATLAAANPAGPLVTALRAHSPAAAEHVHHGATSQDIVDSAMMLIARRGVALVLRDLDAAAAVCAHLADAHRETPMAARTLLQQAVPMSFGMKAATWLSLLCDARDRISGLRFPVQLGGAAGTMSVLGDSGPAVSDALADELGLDMSPVPWHVNRTPVVDVAAAVGIAAGAFGKIALDVTLLAQPEVGEVRAGNGTSSAMPHKQNPSSAVAVQACARRAHALVPVFFGAMFSEHERATGAWQAEWESLSQLLELTSAAAASTRELLAGLEIDTDRMRANLEAPLPGLVMSEAVVTALATHVGRVDARAIIDGAVARSVEAHRPLRDVLLDTAEVSAVLSPAELDRALDPAASFGASSTLIDRALGRSRQARPGAEEEH